VSIRHLLIEHLSGKNKTLKMRYRIKFRTNLPIKALSLRRRYVGLTARDRIVINSLRWKVSILSGVYKMLNCFRDLPIIRNFQKTAIKRMLIHYYLSYSKAIAPPPQLTSALPPIQRLYRTIDSFSDNEIPQYFRFRTKDQLHRLCAGFRFHEAIVMKSRHKFTGEEVLLVSLYRLHQPTTLGDSCWIDTFGLGYASVSMIVNWFVKYLIRNWAYLVLDNMDYWTDSLPEFAEAIRKKANELGCNFNNSREIGGFNVFGFIDNTMNATCRPGGGPARAGKYAPRNDHLIKRAWYNGWKNSMA
jgi:hypothetical protein